MLLLGRAREGWGEISPGSTRYTPPFSPVRKHETPAAAISRLLSLSAAVSTQNWVVPVGVPIERTDASRVYFLAAYTDNVLAARTLTTEPISPLRVDQRQRGLPRDKRAIVDRAGLLLRVRSMHARAECEARRAVTLGLGAQSGAKRNGFSRVDPGRLS